jgi:uncharacterized protein (DUF362 family)
MERRVFLELLAAAQLAPAARAQGEFDPPPPPAYKVVTRYKPAAVPGMPGPYPARVVRTRSPRVSSPDGATVDAAVVREMMERGMRALTGEASAPAAWKRFFEPKDVVAIKVNAGGRPHCVSSPAIVAEIARRLMEVGIPAERIVVYERFMGQLDEVNYAPHLPAGVLIQAAERGNRATEQRDYDPLTYVEAQFFGEEDTRCNMMRLVTERVTKIINVPNMKDHGATGVTGCLKNVAYGSFSNVARTHAGGVTHTLTAVGTLAAVEPLRSRTVLQVMDGLRAVWHGGPFAPTQRYLFHPRQILFGTDPVAIDRLLLDVIDDKRKAEGAISIWDRSPSSVRIDDNRARDADPNVNILIREPAHVEFAGRLGLGEWQLPKIRIEEIEV